MYFLNTTVQVDGVHEVSSMSQLQFLLEITKIPKTETELTSRRSYIVITEKTYSICNTMKSRIYFSKLYTETANWLQHGNICFMSRQKFLTKANVSKIKRTGPNCLCINKNKYGTATAWSYEMSRLELSFQKHLTLYRTSQ